MNIAPSEAKRLTMWEYEAILIEWNRALDKDGDLDPYTVDDWLEAQRFIDENPQFLQ